MQHSVAPRAKILLCVIREKVERLTRVLQGHELHFAYTREEAMRYLGSEGFGMVIVGVHFDESQMFNLLGDIRLHAKYRKVPILVVLSQGRYALSDVVVEAIDHAVKAMTANGFIDFGDFPDDEKGNGRLRRIVDHLILIDGDLLYDRAGKRQRV